MKNAQRQPSTPPAHQVMKPTINGLALPRTCVAEVHERRHPGPDADRVVVGEQRRVHRDVARLGDAGQADEPEEDERVGAKPVRNVNPAASQRGDADDRDPLRRGPRASPIGIAPSA